jgi:Zn-dependent protease with chaperone function
MNKYFYALYVAGQNVSWNIAFHFLRLYNFIFRRISHGSTRLQEVLADHFAAKTYGYTAFKNGLTYVIKREIEFNKYALQEVNEAKEHNRSFNNLYELSGNLCATIEEELQVALNRATTEDDTHPAPNDRFRYIKNVNANSVSISYDDSKIKALFKNWDAITQEMTKLVEKEY